MRGQTVNCLPSGSEKMKHVPFHKWSGHFRAWEQLPRICSEHARLLQNCNLSEGAHKFASSAPSFAPSQPSACLDVAINFKKWTMQSGGKRTPGQDFRQGYIYASISAYHIHVLRNYRLRNLPMRRQKDICWELDSPSGLNIWTSNHKRIEIIKKKNVQIYLVKNPLFLIAHSCLNKFPVGTTVL